ncbi:MAG: PadR family transcriptional regulator [Candidatus Hodarchaeota archaeon]
MTTLDRWESGYRKGFAKPTILQILMDEGESYPYKLTKQIPKRTQGMLTMASSNIYPILKDLKDEGLIQIIEEKERKVMYGLTKEGQTFLTELQGSLTKFLIVMLENFSNEKRG